MLPKDQRAKIMSLNKAVLQTFVSRLNEHVRKALVENEKDLSVLGQKFRDSVLEQSSPSLKLSEEALSSLKLLEGTNELEFAKKESQHQDVEWLVGMLLLLMGKRDMVDPRSLVNTWAHASDYLSNEITKSDNGLGNAEAATE